MRVAVVGAGVVGLSTALNVLQDIPNVKVTVIAEKFGSETTSSGAGGHFRPNLNHTEGVAKAQLMNWCLSSRDHFFRLADSAESSTSGAMMMSGYLLQDTPEGGFLPETVRHFRQLTAQELTDLKFSQRYGYVYTTVVIEMKKYLQWLTSRISDYGGSFCKRRVELLQELAGDYDVVVNCSGLGARELVNDIGMYPVRGQLVKVKAPWIKMFYTCESDGVSTYIYPHSETVNLGGCRIKGEWSLETDKDVTRDILRRTHQLVPALEGATVVDEWVGLRPTRRPLRLESEKMNVGGKILQIVHNYGHGALGITLSWGTAVQATALVKSSLQPSSKL